MNHKLFQICNATIGCCSFPEISSNRPFSVVLVHGFRLKTVLH